jgi:YDG domain
VAGDLLTLSYASASFADPSVGANKTVTVLGINVTGLDAGNYSWNTSTTTTASILAWNLAGYYQPVDMPSGGMVWNTIKGGQTVPLKFQIFVGSTERTDVGAVKAFTATPTSCGTPGIDDLVEITTTGATELRYSGGQFIQNWQTPKGANMCYRTTMTAQDGSLLTAYFKTK